MLALASLILVAASMIHTDTSSLPYFNPQGSERSSWNYAVMGLGSIPLELGEKVLIDEHYPELGVSNVIILINREYKLVHDEVRSLVSQKMGIAQEIEGSHVKLGEMHPWMKTTRENFDGAAWPPMGEGLVAFQVLDMQFGPPIEYELMSRPYNETDRVTGFSELYVRISDARELFGKTVTLIQLRRRDHSKEWFRLGHLGFANSAIPLPFKKYWDFDLVTDTEVSLIEQLKKREQNISVLYFLTVSRLKGRVLR
jgi:hypothetical protein